MQIKKLIKIIFDYFNDDERTTRDIGILVLRILLVIFVGYLIITGFIDMIKGV